MGPGLGLGSMLYDRDYMRGAEGAPWRSPVNVLLVILTALFLVECYLRVYEQTSLRMTFGLSYAAIQRYEYWRLLSYQFLHDAPWPWHLLFNGLALWFFGRSVLETLGRGRFWQVFLLAGVLGGIVELGWQALNPRYGMAPTVGASASVLGLAGAYCFLFPARETVFFFYVIPVRMRSMTMFWVLLGFSLFGTIFPHGGVAHAAHLGGLLTGAAFARFFGEEDIGTWLRRFAPRRAARREAVPVTAEKSAGRTGRGAPTSTDGESRDDFIRREVDPILDKISAHGIQSLTDRERRILEKARERMRGR